MIYPKYNSTYNSDVDITMEDTKRNLYDSSIAQSIEHSGHEGGIWVSTTITTTVNCGDRDLEKLNEHMDLRDNRKTPKHISSNL